MDLSTLSPVAVLVAAASFFLIGGLWYGAVFAQPWARAAGVDSEALRTGAGRVFGGSAVIALVVAASMAAFLGEVTAGEGALIGLIAGLTFAAAPLWMVMLFERRPWVLGLMDGGYLVLAFTVVGAVIGALQ